MNEDLEARVGALEAQITILAESNAATRVIASMADRDTAEMRGLHRGTTRLLTALRQTQLEQGHELTGLREQLLELTGLRETQLEQSLELTGLRETQLEQSHELTGLRQTQLEQSHELTGLRETQLDHGRLLTEILRRLPEQPGGV